MEINNIYYGNVMDILPTLPDQSVHTCVTSPPYWGLRDYGVDGQLGLESTPEEYVQHMVEVFREVRRILRDDGTLWLNLGDSYAVNRSSGATKHSGNPEFNRKSGSRERTKLGEMHIPDGLKSKDLVGIPWMVAFALRADGWYLRSDIIWSKPNAMPESVRDRPTKSHEYIFLLSKSPKYYYDKDTIREPYSESSLSRYNYAFNADTPSNQATSNPATKAGNIQPNPLGKNKRSVWTVTTKSFKGAHFATFPPDLIEPCVLAGAPEGGIVLDPFFGAGTTGLVAIQNGRNYVGIELNLDYVHIASDRLNGVQRKL